MNEAIENLFKNIAQYLELAYATSKARGEDVVTLLHKNKILVIISTFIDRDGKLNFIANTGGRTAKPEFWGAFKRDELMTQARSAIIDKLSRLMEK